MYKDNELEFVPTGEGRVIFENHKAVYEYHYKDHLGNLRIAFREAQSQKWFVGAELLNQSYEETEFANVNQTRADKPQSLNEKACKTDNQKPLGWWKSVSVQKGDVIYARCDAFFERVPQIQNTGINWNLFLFANPDYALNNGENMLNPNNNLVGIGILPTFANNTASIPKAYLIAQFYNETNQPTHQKILYVTQNNQSWNTLGEIQEIALENGRVEIFVANESNTKVHFDNLSIYKSPTPIVQENHYYPFGMNLVGIEKEGTPNHRFQYNGQEKDTSFGLDWISYKHREYDVRISRFMCVDPITEQYEYLTPYQFASDNPASKIELEGLEGIMQTFLNEAVKPNVQEPLKKGCEVAKDVISIKVSTQVLGLGMGAKINNDTKFDAGVKVFRFETSVSNKEQKIEFADVQLEFGLSIFGKSAGFEGRGITETLDLAKGTKALDTQLKPKAKLTTSVMPGVEVSPFASKFMGNAPSPNEPLTEITTKNTSAIKGTIGQISATIEANLGAAKETITYGWNALTGFISNVFTNVTQNTFGTDSKKRSQETYIKEEIKK